MRTHLFVILAGCLAAVCACTTVKSSPGGKTTDPAKTSTKPTVAANARVAAVAADDPLYARVEGVSQANNCAQDADCQLGGCSSEICSAAEGINSSCDIQEWPTKGASCGCVNSLCIWYTDKSGKPKSDLLTGQGGACKDKKCKDGLTCVTYFGIAGPAVTLTSCEVRCSEGEAACPAGQKCVTIPDGPGQVCRPMK